VTRAFNFFEKRSNVVVGDPGGEATHGSRLDLEGLSLWYRDALGQGHSKSFVHDRFERTAGPPRLSLEARSNIVVKR
jgi:hypothetical protein